MQELALWEEALQSLFNTVKEEAEPAYVISTAMYRIENIT